MIKHIFWRQNKKIFPRGTRDPLRHHKERKMRGEREREGEREKERKREE